MRMDKHKWFIKILEFIDINSVSSSGCNTFYLSNSWSKKFASKSFFVSALESVRKRNHSLAIVNLAASISSLYVVVLKPLLTTWRAWKSIYLPGYDGFLRFKTSADGIVARAIGFSRVTTGSTSCY